MTTYSLSWVSMFWRRIMPPSCWLIWVKLEVWLVVQKWCLRGMKWSSLVWLAPILGSGYPFLSYLISSFPHISLSFFTFTTSLTCTLNMKAVCLKHGYMVSQSRLVYESSPCQGWNAVITLPLSPYCLYVTKVSVACLFIHIMIDSSISDITAHPCLMLLSEGRCTVAGRKSKHVRSMTLSSTIAHLFPASLHITCSLCKYCRFTWTLHIPIMLLHIAKKDVTPFNMAW